MMDYENRVQGFIIYALSNPRNTSGNGIRCLYKRYKNKKFLNSDVVTMYFLQKGFMERYMCKLIRRTICSLRDMIGSIYSSSNVHRIVNDNNNSYRNMVMETMRMN